MINTNNLTKTINKIFDDERVATINYALGPFKYKVNNVEINGNSAFLIDFKPEYQSKRFIITLDNNNNYILCPYELVLCRFRNYISSDNLIGLPTTIFQQNHYSELLNNLLFKVTNYEKSSKIFGYSNVKKNMLNKTYKVTRMLFGYQSQQNDERYNIAEVYNPSLSKNLKFVIDDLELLEPNLVALLKGYVLPKVKIITKNTKVLVVDKHRFPLSKTQPYTVLETRKIGETVYCNIKHDGYNYMINEKNLKFYDK